MKLIEAEPGMELEICELPSGNIKTQLIQLGVSEGIKVKCANKLPGGTVVISKGYQEIAIGNEIAKKITVRKN